jgi:hypothetical protein
MPKRVFNFLAVFIAVFIAVYEQMLECHSVRKKLAAIAAN